MSSDMTDSDRVSQLLQGSKSFGEIAKEFDDEIDCYYSLQDAAKTNLRSFDEYLRFYKICIDQGPTGFVYSRLNRNAKRSLKNMVIRDSTAGERFPINSLSELNKRVQSYKELGVDDLTTKDVVSTILEHIYEEREESVYEICDNLLYNSDQAITGKKLLVHARFASVATSVDRDTDAFDYYMDEFFSDLPDPYPKDDRSADELWKHSEDAAYSEDKKLKLAQSSLTRQPTEERLTEYLYLEARDIVERYRHTQQEPKRAELQLCSHQIRLLQARFSEFFEAEQDIRLRSYRKVALGQGQSGNWWSSQQETTNRPDPNYRKAAAHFYDAAQIIKPVDQARFLKYFSKAVRNAATAATYEGLGPANGWKVRMQLHEMAASLFSNLSEHDNKDVVAKTIDESIALHQCKGSQAAAVFASYEGDAQETRESVNEAWEVLKTGDVPVYINPDFLKALDTIAEALKYKRKSDFAKAAEEFKSVRIAENLLPTEQPEKLEKIKIHLIEENYDEALELTENTFAEGTPIRTAVEILAGEESHTPRLTDEHTYPIIGVSDSSIWSLAMFVEFIEKGNQIGPELLDQLEKLIIDL